MTKTEIQEKLKELGIETKNAHPKYIIHSGEGQYVSLFDNEFVQDFYFYNSLDKSIYKIEATSSFQRDFGTEVHLGEVKYLVPKHNWIKIFPNEKKVEYSPEKGEYSQEFVEVEDEHMNMMTLRDYACIQLGTAQSNKKWLNDLINKQRKGG